jgi:flagellar hook-associated protein 2
MSTSGLSSLLSSLNPSTNESLAELLGESSTSSAQTASTNSTIQDAVNAILNSATNTSGAGIDVTSTVNAILQIDAQPEVNLQSQVTTLGTQTTALQGIETDLASLQTAVQALTDPTGAFSAVTVSSSNNDVVSATAGAGATAGTHTVVVNSLATTSAYYSAPQTSSTTALPPGEFDLQVGNNAAVPIPVDSADNTDTLSDLATYINDQNLGVSASVISDSSGASLSLVSQTSGTGGIIAVSNDTTGADISGSFTSASTELPTGSFDLQVGSNSATIPVDSGDNTDTLTGLASYINLQDLGVTASVITNASGASLALVPQNTGSAGKITVSSDTTGMGFPSTYTPPTVLGMGFTAATQDVNGSPVPLGTDASLTVDGVPVTSSSNTVTGAIPGITLTLSGTSSSPVTLAIQPDLTQVGTAINNFVTAYNQVMTDINTQNTFSGSGTPPPLLGDPSLDLLQSQLLNGVITSITGNNGLVNLQSIGIQLQENGTLTVQSTSSPDSMDLNDALSNDFSAVQNLFQSAASSTAGVGVAQALNTSLTSLTDPTNGPLNLDMTGITSQVTDLNTQITSFQYQLQQTQTQLMNEYTLINTTLEQLPETLASINSQLNSLNPPNTSNG